MCRRKRLTTCICLRGETESRRFITSTALTRRSSLIKIKRAFRARRKYQGGDSVGLPDDNLLYGFAPKLTDEQREYVDSIFDNQLTIVNAKAGTGKTTLAVACAAVFGKPLTYLFSSLSECTMGVSLCSTAYNVYEYVLSYNDACVDIAEK